MTAEKYIWQCEGWPRLRWSQAALQTPLSELYLTLGRLQGMLDSMAPSVREEARFNAVSEGVRTSSAIEGVSLDIRSLWSSVARRLNIPRAGLPDTGGSSGHYEDGIVEAMLDAVGNPRSPLTRERLMGWHAALFPTGYSGMFPIGVGRWRTLPMQVVSGPVGRERVHCEAPPPNRVADDMDAFLHWVNGGFSMRRKESCPSRCAASADAPNGGIGIGSGMSDTIASRKDTNEGDPPGEGATSGNAQIVDSPAVDPFVEAAIAHLWFVTVHPFDDGNGRIARTICDMMLARADGMAYRSYTMSAAILKKRQEYYDILETTQSGAYLTVDAEGVPDITPWLCWFLRTLRIAMDDSIALAMKSARKACFWQVHRSVPMNPRQLRLVDMLWEGFEGKLTTGKWAKIAKVSQATALRDIQELVEHGVLVASDAGGRSTSYRLCDDAAENP